MRAFISYCHHDGEALSRLKVHLAGLKREGAITTWYDHEILAGDKLDDEISAELEAADLFLLLVSPDFIASSYCIEREMKRALERHETGDARVIPIIIEPCDWSSIGELRSLKALPKDALPISEWVNSNSGYLDVIQELRRIVERGIRKPAKVPEDGSQQLSASERSTLRAPQYRVKRDFDQIDKSDFRDAAFAEMRSYFERAVAELDRVDGLKGRFIGRSDTSFGATVVNRTKQLGTAHITVHCQSGHHAFADIYYSFDENAAAGTANGGFNVDCDEYEQYLTAGMSVFGKETDRLSSAAAAKALWQEFIEQAGIVYA
ncbi:toll/interleukin-1 receptor domain-containing protein [uncultured Roseobacter sp.]|uniref:toll/interleukin-1 receptor domain-containing protein n=1 Tax=uncultured Roseobacter sp. TaxID=114847 RepID=UPI00260824F5|nr:toll/interleukin-1 receptor domain-containing protein [uncultured Roseobacter sp.]